MALQNVQRIQIELDGSAPFEYVVAKAGEKESRIVEVTLLENKKEFTIPAGTTAKIKYYKPDGKFVLNNATISGNVITVTYTEQMLAVSGTGRGELFYTTEQPYYEAQRITRRLRQRCTRKTG